MATSDGGTTWASQTVPPGVSALKEVSCPSASTCFADGIVSSTGTVMIATHDGGTTWTIQTLPAGVNGLGPLSCPSVSNCYAPTSIGSTSVVVTTTNGGATWTSHAAPGSLSSISCPSVSVCFASGFVLVQGAVVFETTDGGATWTNRTVPTGTGEIDALSCPSTSTCSAFGSAAISTTDAGATWTIHSIPSNDIVSAVSCPSTTTCFATGDNLGTGFVIGTSDGGTTWTNDTVPPTDGQAGISCSSVHKCWVAGGFGPGAIIASTDGGATWTIQSDVPFGVQLSGISCPTSLSCYAAGTDGLVGIVITTTDGGATWTNHLLSEVTGVTLSCPSATTCFAVGSGTGTDIVIKTTDGFSTWSDLSLPTPYLESISCASTANCMAVGQNVAFATTDGGSTWAAQTMPSGVADLSSVSCPSATTCYAVGGGFDSSGSSGDVAATTDGGTTWVNKTPGGMAEMFAISCPSALICYSAGFGPDSTDRGGIMTTTDGGTTWSGTTVGAAALTSIGCPATTVCFAAGDEYTPPGEIVKTTDGSSWSNQTLPSGVHQVTGISCATTAACMASGLNDDLGGTILSNMVIPPTTYNAIVVNAQSPTSNSISTISGSGASWTAGSPLVVGSGNIGLTSIAFAPSGATAYQAVGGEDEIVPITLSPFAAGTPFSSVVPSPQQDAVTPNGQLLLVTGGNQLAVIDTADTSISQTVTVGNGAWGIAISPDSSTAYITNSTDGSVSEVSLEGTPSVVKTITFPDGGCGDPEFIAMQPNGNKLWVDCHSDNYLWKIKVSTETAAGSGILIPTGASAGNLGQVVITPTNQNAYVASGKKVYPVNLSTTAVGAPISIGTDAWSLAISPDGAYLLAGLDAPNTDVVKAISTSTNSVTATFSAGGSAHFSVEFQP